MSSKATGSARVQGCARIALCAAALLCLPAQAITVNFDGSGSVTGPAQTPPFFVGLEVLPASTSYVVNGDPGWQLGSLFDFNAVTLTGTGTATLSKAGDSISLLINTSTSSLGAPLAMTYTAIGGTGAFLGLVGSGTSTVQLLGNPLGLPVAVPYVETGGVLNLSPVPEPSALLLGALSAAFLLARMARRRVAGVNH